MSRLKNCRYILMSKFSCPSWIIAQSTTLKTFFLWVHEAVSIKCTNYSFPIILIKYLINKSKKFLILNRKLKEKLFRDILLNRNKQSLQTWRTLGLNWGRTSSWRSHPRLVWHRSPCPVRSCIFLKISKSHI